MDRAITLKFTWTLLLVPLTLLGQGGDPRATLALADKKPVYRMGEPIRLLLSFSTRSGSYNVDLTVPIQPSCEDQFSVSPQDGVVKLENTYCRDFVSIEPLTAESATMPFTLNDYYRFDKPGTYSASVTSRRVSNSTGADQPQFPFPLTSNEISFVIAAASEEQEAAEVRRISEELAATRDATTKRTLASELSYLDGESAIREKVKWFVEPGFPQFALRLDRSSNRPLVSSLLEAALRDPAVEPNYSLFQIVTATGEKSPSDYAEELAASLPFRAGANRRAAAVLLVMRAGQNTDLAAAVRPLLVREFAFLVSRARNICWARAGTPSAIPLWPECWLSYWKIPAGSLILRFVRTL